MRPPAALPAPPPSAPRAGSLLCAAHVQKSGFAAATGRDRMHRGFDLDGVRPRPTWAPAWDETGTELLSIDSRRTLVRCNTWPDESHGPFYCKRCEMWLRPQQVSEHLERKYHTRNWKRTRGTRSCGPAITMIRCAPGRHKSIPSQTKALRIGDSLADPVLRQLQQRVLRECRWRQLVLKLLRACRQGLGIFREASKDLVRLGQWPHQRQT